MLTNVHYLPVSVFILLPSSFIVTYIIAIWLGHCEVVLPYISDTGVKIPESCIFSQMLNLVSFLIVLTLLVRYKQVEQQCKDYLAPDANRVFRLNKISLYFGLLSACGISIVANFQELQLFVVHMIGAFSAFGFGLIYCTLQTIISYHMYRVVKDGLILAHCRLALTIIFGITYLTTCVFGPIALHYFKGIDMTIWQPSDGGYLYHLISSICEWISAISIDFYILSFAHEFKYMSISSPKFYILPIDRPLYDENESNESDTNTIHVVERHGSSSN